MGQREEWERVKGNDEERNAFLQNSANEYKEKQKTLAKRYKPRKEQEKRIQTLDVTTGELLNITIEEANKLVEKHQQDKKQQKNISSEQKNLNFIQLQKGAGPEVISKIAETSALAVQVLMFFFKNMSKEGVLAVSQSTIAETLGKTRQGISKAIKVLEDNHAVAKAKIGGNSVVYIINPDIAWQKTNVQKKVMYLNGVIMLHKDENKRIFESFERLQEVELKPLSIKTGKLTVAQKNAPTVSTDPSKAGPSETTPDDPFENPYDDTLDEDEYYEHLAKDYEENN